jgi:hypothetical protein
MTTHNVTRDTVRLYCEGLLTDAKLCRKIERQLLIPDSDAARWAKEAADELGPSAEARTTIRSQFTCLREELTSPRVNPDVVTPGRTTVKSKMAAREKRKAPAANALAAASRQEASVELDQPLTYADGILTVNVNREVAPYGVIDVQLREVGSEREVARFHAAVPLHKRFPNRRYTKIDVAARLPKSVDPRSVKPWIALAGDAESLRCFEVMAVETLLAEPMVSNDKELQSSIGRLLDELR